MKANELRIGNYYSAPLEIKGSVEARINFHQNREFVLTLDALILLGQLDLLHLLKPIPLTEEWLEKFGFKKTNSIKAFESDKFSLNSFWLSLHKSLTADGFAWDDYDYRLNGNRLWIEHVHQLQNLYHALTGEELQIKVPA